METLEQATKILAAELTSTGDEVRKEFLGHFEAELKEFEGKMAEAVLAWKAFDGGIGTDAEKGLVSALIYAAIMLHVQSMKLFISGHIVAAGALMRQVVEAIALAFLCSNKDLGVLSSLSNNRYSTNDAVVHLSRSAKKVGLLPDGLDALKKAQSFYHKYSHISMLTIAAGMSMEGKGIFVGASFDEGKLDAYRKEVAGRVSLANVFSNFVAGVVQNVAKWK
jgi:hypothetical protein